MNLNDFKNKFNLKENFLFYKEFNTDLITPLSIFLNLKKKNNDIVFLESTEKIGHIGRYTAIAIKPDLKWVFENNKIIITDQNKNKTEFVNSDPIKNLKKFINNYKIKDFHGLPNMAAGIFGYFGYDMSCYSDNINLSNEESLIPDSYFIRAEAIIIFDNLHHKFHISLPIWINEYSQKNIENLYSYKLKLFDNILSDIKSYKVEDFVAPSNNYKSYKIEAYPSREDFINIVNQCKKHIIAGDIFQIVPSRRFEAKYDIDPANFYRALRRINPSPFLFYFGLDDFVITGSSPEVMVKTQDEKVIIRPLAGTRKRTNNKEEDLKIADELLNDKKEIDEHLMLLDLGRNDVGRVAKDNSVKVTKYMEIEYYSHVMHISSTVEGILKKNYDAIDALLAGFPAGTVSGAPKIKAMEILAKLEKYKRSFYAGSIGYFSANKQNMDMAITIRTALFKNGKIYFQTGAGIVYDSDPIAEFEETNKKANALIEAYKTSLNN